MSWVTEKVRGSRDLLPKACIGDGSLRFWICRKEAAGNVLKGSLWRREVGFLHYAGWVESQVE